VQANVLNRLVFEVTVLKHFQKDFKIRGGALGSVDMFQVTSTIYQQELFKNAFVITDILCRFVEKFMMKG